MKEIIDFNDLLKNTALDFARKNAIATKGDIVTTVWADRKKPHKVVISDVGAGLSYVFDEDEKEFKATLEMFYYAKRLTAAGSVFAGDENGGIVLNYFVKSNGTKWEQSGHIINHGAYNWTLP